MLKIYANSMARLNLFISRLQVCIRKPVNMFAIGTLAITPVFALALDLNLNSKFTVAKKRFYYDYDYHFDGKYWVGRVKANCEQDRYTDKFPEETVAEARLEKKLVHPNLYHFSETKNSAVKVSTEPGDSAGFQYWSMSWVYANSLTECKELAMKAKILTEKASLDRAPAEFRK